MKTKTINTSNDTKNASQACDYIFTIGDLVMRLAAVERAPRYKNGDRENDVEHSFHLALSAAELAVNYYPELNPGLVSQFSLVHDLPESYVGDTWTIRINDEDRAKKEIAEGEATKRLINELPPHTSQLLERYEKQIEPEARFVRFVDKLLPEVINLLAGDSCTFMDDHSIHDIDEMDKVQSKINKRCGSIFPEFPLVLDVRKLIIKRFSEFLFGNKNQTK